MMSDSSTSEIQVSRSLRRGRSPILDFESLKWWWNSHRVGLFVTLLAVYYVFAFSMISKASTADLNEVAPAKTSAQMKDKISGVWNLKFGGRNFQEAEDEATHLNMGLHVDGKYQLSQQLHLQADVGLKLASGREQTRFAPAGEDSSRISFDQFYLNFAANDFVDFRVGAMSQKFIGVSGLVDASMSFPGFMEEFRWKSSHWSSALTLQQVIPASKSLDVDRREKEELPRFFSETFAVAYQSPKWWTTKVALTHFQFKDLPSVVASKSGNLGNTVIGRLSADSSFAFDFSGIASAIDFCLCGYESIKYKLNYQYLENFEADAGFNKGQSLTFGMSIIGGGMNIQPGYTVFYNESDTSPAYYNSSGRGHNNRVGQETALNVEFPEANFRVLARYTIADVINVDPTQEELTTTYVGLETLDVSF